MTDIEELQQAINSPSTPEDIKRVMRQKIAEIKTREKEQHELEIKAQKEKLDQRRKNRNVDTKQ